MLFAFMSSLSEKQAFSERLLSALSQAGYTSGPTALAKEFNLRFSGTEISVQSANNWLQGKAIPSQEKLSILALWLGVSSQWLRFGEQLSENQVGLTEDQIIDIDYFHKFKSLTPNQKHIVQRLIDEFRTL